MNAVAQTLAIALASVAAAAAIGLGLADRNAPPPAQVVKLDRVVVYGQQAPVAVVARLPRVVVEKRRVVAPDVTVAQAPAAPAL